MYTILKKELLNSNEIYLMEIRAPWIAQRGMPGQFVIVIPHDKGERVPLTICDIHPEHESIDIVYQVVGDSTRHLSTLNEGDRLFAIVGPLGRTSELITAPQEEQRQMHLLFVAGGVGIAPVYPQVKWAHNMGIPTDVIIGARNKSLLFFEDKMRAVCDNLYIMTDDGSYGEQGLVTTKIKSLYSEYEGTETSKPQVDTSRYTHCVAIGPLPMMKFVSLLTKELGLKTIVSMNCMMVDGTGMCGACRVTVGDEVKFTCVDGPEFDGHLVNFEEAARRLKRPDERRYRIATIDENDGHHCNLSDPVAATIQRQKPREQDPAVRATNFDEVSLGFTAEQAVTEARRCLHCKKPMCVTQCPVSIKIPDFIAAVANEDFALAADIIAQDSTLPAVCGRVCPQENQCEGSCILGHKGEPIAIGALERFVADWKRNNSPESPEYSEPSEISEKKKVAVIGSGPSGLACAGDLAKKGYSVTIFEALHHAGGVLVYGIPEFRLPKQKVVEPEINNLRHLGVEIKTNVIVGKSLTVDDLFDRHGFKAVYIASGAGLPKFMGIPGETLGGVLSANELLTRTNLMHGYDKGYDTPIYLGHRVAVIGGGNVAMDAARTALRLGSDVTVIYRREQADMPARREEVHHAMEEGIQFSFLTNPVAFLGDEQGNVRDMRCIRMEMGEKDEKGRRKFTPIEGSEFEMEVDNVVVALGTSPNPLIKLTTPGLDTQSWGGLVADNDGRTSRPGIFAGGDAVTGAATVILAMGAGRTAAKAIDEYLTSKQ
ncbi:MAG: NADPH-dependent glutamate synthase [Bacteroidales bacterium]|nr:NADPH-dependent glutamate synthase [Bacteroidales bacterium]